MNNAWLRRFSKLTCFSTLFLIFAGSLVTSTGSGLAVPDWPLSYGMVFPPMVGGVFYEHGHRMIASLVGFFTLIQAFWIQFSDNRTWVKALGWLALLAVICQGVLGGLTVLFLLPTPISVSHAVLSQTFFVLTIIIAYALSTERAIREAIPKSNSANISPLTRTVLLLGVLIYVQLIIGALMRHTDSGLAIPDFPTVANQIIPAFNNDSLVTINKWRFNANLEPVNMAQVLVHFIHRMMGYLIGVVAFVLLFVKLRMPVKVPQSNFPTYGIFVLILIQILLGAFTIWSGKNFIITSIHVVNGATLLGLSCFLTLRLLPLSISKSSTHLH